MTRTEHQIGREILKRLLEDPRLNMKRSKQPKMPETKEEWQAAVDAAKALLCLDSARLYGFVTGGPNVNVGRAEAMLLEGKRRGLTPSPDAIETFIAAWNQQPRKGTSS
jgi:hypothetical protein